MLRTSTIFLVLAALYTLLMVRHAWVGGRRSRTLEDYFVGGRSLGGVVLAVSFFATYSSTNTFLGFSGKAYAWGPAWLLLVPFAVGFAAISWVFVAPRLRRFTGRLESMTVPDFIGFRYSSSVGRVLAAVIVVLASVLYMTAIFKGVGNLFESLLGLRYAVAIAVVLALVVLYTLVGGFHAVVRTDAIQGILMVLAAIALCVGVIRASQLSPGELLAAVVEGDSAGRASSPPLGILLGVLFATTIKFVVEPRQLSRFYALRSESEAKAGTLTATGLILITFTCLAPIGLWAGDLVPELADSDLLVPTLLSSGEVFGEATTALLGVAILAAAMSSLDSVLLVVATTCQRDLLTLHAAAAARRESIVLTRVLVAVFALITAGMALRPPGDIVALTSLSGALYGACFLPAVVLGLWWRRGDSAAVIASMVVGALVLVLWPLLPLHTSLHGVFPAVGLSAVAFWALARRPAAAASPQIEALFAETGL